MARFLLGTIPVAGIVNPVLPIARQLVERGNEVCWYTGKGFQSQVETTGASFVPIQAGIDLSDRQTIPKSFIEAQNSLKGLDHLRFRLKHIFIDSAVVQMKELIDILHKFPSDIVLSDSMFLGASWVYEQGGPPWQLLIRLYCLSAVAIQPLLPRESNPTPQP